MRIWLLLWIFASASAQAMHPAVLHAYLDGSRQALTVDLLRQFSGWFECSESDLQPVWCREPFDYYTTGVWAQAALAELQGNLHGSKLMLHAQFDIHHWSQMQLGLRRDGLHLQRARHGEQVFDVAQQLRGRPPQEVDKALVLFVNRHARRFPKILVWHSTTVSAVLFTDGQSIELTFRPAQESLLEGGVAEKQP